MAKEKKAISVLELPLYPEIWQADRINKKMENVARIYNQTRRYLLGQYRALTTRRDFKETSDLIYTLNDLTKNWSGDGGIKEFHEQRCKGYKLDKEENKEKKESGLAKYEELKNQELTAVEFISKLRKIPISSDIFLQELKEIRDSLTKEQKKEYSAKIKELYAERNQSYKDIGLTEFGIISIVLKNSKYYSASVPSRMATLSVSGPLWSAFERLLYKNGENVSYKRFEFSNSIATDGKTGIRLLKDEKGYYLLMSNRNAKAKEMRVRVGEPKTAFEKDMINRNIKIVRVVRRFEKSKYHYYMQLSVEGTPYLKKNDDGSLKHEAGKDLVSLSIWRNELYAVSDKEVRKFALSEGQEAFELEKDRLNKKMEKLRRENNPDNFEEDGTIKKGIIVDGVKQRLVWKESVQYQELKKKKRNLERVHRVNRELLHRKISYSLLEMGSSFVFTKTSFKTNKPEFDEDERLTNTEYRKKKARRKSIQESAPYDLKQKLNSKLSTYGLPEIKELDIKDDLYWYRFDTDSQDRDKLNGEYITLLGKTCPHTAYRAFISRYYDEETQRYDQKAIADNWDKFIDNVLNSI